MVILGNSLASFSGGYGFKSEAGDRLRGFSKTLHANAGTVPQIRLRFVLPSSSAIHYPPIYRTVDAVLSELLAAPLSKQI
jgi:hypothetical protein